MSHFDPFMRKAFIILSVVGVVFTLLSSTDSPHSEGVFLIAGLTWHVIYNVFVIFLLKKLATDDGILKSQKPITTWGYIWRTLIVSYTSLIPAMLAALITFGTPPYSSIETFVFIYALHLIASIAAVWCIFSRDRKSQIGWLFSVVRGY